MSRSALEKQWLRQQAATMKAQAVANYTATMNAAYAQSYYDYGQQAYPITTSAVDPNAPSSGYVPLLTGDDEEYEDPNNKPNALPIHGNSSNFNINNLLFNNIMENDYFRALYQLRTYHEVIGEIQRSVIHVEPWQTGTSRFPSSAFCLLVKFMLMRLTVKQMNGLLDFEGCSFVRAIGFLYLRYTCAPADLWKWYEPYLEDSEEIFPASDKTIKMSMGQYLIKLLIEMQYFGTTLPRIPVPIERKIKVLLLLLEEKKKRRKQNSQLKDKFLAGTKVKAIYSDKDNEPAWYEAVIDSVDEENEGVFWVTYVEYGNSAAVDLGDMELIVESVEKVNTTSSKENEKEKDRPSHRDGSKGRKSRSRSRSRSDSRERRGKPRDNRDSRSPHRHRSRSRSGGGDDQRRMDRDRDRGGKNGSTEDLLAKVIQGEREASAAIGRNYGSRPASYKGALSMKLDRYTARRKSPSPNRNNNNHRNHRRRSRTPSPSPPRSNKHSFEAGIEQQNRLKLLRDRYGDASAAK